MTQWEMEKIEINLFDRTRWTRLWLSTERCRDIFISTLKTTKTLNYIFCYLYMRREEIESQQKSNAMNLKFGNVTICERFEFILCIFIFHIYSPSLAPLFVYPREKVIIFPSLSLLFYNENYVGKILKTTYRVAAVLLYFIFCFCSAVSSLFLWCWTPRLLLVLFTRLLEKSSRQKKYYTKCRTRRVEGKSWTRRDKGTKDQNMFLKSANFSLQCSNWKFQTRVICWVYNAFLGSRCRLSKHIKSIQCRSNLCVYVSTNSDGDPETCTRNCKHLPKASWNPHERMRVSTNSARLHASDYY